ncbi:hypothetical protein BHE90_007722 [Fusarium euwallaceae]|uniref:Uncharacterized protein n=2 Tax=Fusarium solani species complex TaxID=232080 RepID=A0A430LPZ8_9HYPO|nr:hypothetical protein CDV31_005272 [Fusarium ambrosium]RTE77802.1 hypothetical protein BHE90_007722 [Fusarium euwallaceae]
MVCWVPNARPRPARRDFDVKSGNLEFHMEDDEFEPFGVLEEAYSLFLFSRLYGSQKEPLSCRGDGRSLFAPKGP